MANEETAPIWDFVPLANYTPPPPDVVETARRGIVFLWRRLRPNAEPPLASPVMAEDALAKLPDWQLRRAAPPLDWTAAADALDAALADWPRGDDDGQAVRLLVTPPHIGRRDQFLFTTDLTVRGKAALTALGVDFAQALPTPEA